jgi:hypothetical protein
MDSVFSDRVVEGALVKIVEELNDPEVGYYFSFTPINNIVSLCGQNLYLGYSESLSDFPNIEAYKEHVKDVIKAELIETISSLEKVLEKFHSESSLSIDDLIYNDLSKKE